MALFNINIYEKDSSEIKQICYNPLTGLFGGINHVVPDIHEKVKELCEYFENMYSKKNTYNMRIDFGKACNFKCKYCMQKGIEKEVQDYNNINIDELCESIIYVFKISKKEKLSINFFGGEPLLYWDYIKNIVQILKMSDIKEKVSFCIITNGSLFNGEIANFCIKYSIFVTLSYDGIDGQKLRGLDPLEPRTESYYSFLYFNRIRPDLLNFNPVLTRNNYNILNIYRYISNRMHCKIRIGEGTLCTPSSMNDDFSVIDESSLEECSNVIVSIGINRLFQRFYMYSEMFVELYKNCIKHQPVELKGRCNAFSDFPYVIELDGTIKRCATANKNFLFQPNIINECGNIIDIYRNRYNVEQIIAILEDKPYSWINNENCLNCPYTVTCRGCCPVLTTDQNIFDISCKQSIYLSQAFFALFLQVLYPKMTGFSIERIL